MTRFVIEHTFETDVPTFWRLFFHEPANLELDTRLGMKERRVLESHDDGATLRRVIRYVPGRDLPAFLRKLAGDSIGYVETSTLHRADDRIDVAVEPTVLAERTRMTATLTVRPAGPGRVVRRYEGAVSIDVPLVGRKIEEFVVSDLRRSYDVAAEVTTSWLRRGL